MMHGRAAPQAHTVPEELIGLSRHPCLPDIACMDADGAKSLKACVLHARFTDEDGISAST